MQVSAGASSPRTTLTVVFGAFGAAIGALAGSMPSVMRNAGLDAETFGLGLTISTCSTVAAMSLGRADRAVRLEPPVLLIVLPVFALALLAYLTAQSPVWFFMAIPLMGLCFGLTDLFMNAEAVALEHDMRRPVFMAFHGAVSAGVAMMAVATSFLSTAVGTWSAGAVVAALFALAWVMVYRGIAPRPLAKGTAGRLASLPNKAPLMLLGIAAGLIIAAETAALLWSAKLLDEMAPALAAIAGVGAAFFGLCNAAVRFPGDRLRSARGRHAADGGVACHLHHRLRSARPLDELRAERCLLCGRGLRARASHSLHLRPVGAPRAGQPRRRVELRLAADARHRASWRRWPSESQPLNSARPSPSGLWPAGFSLPCC